MARPSGWCASCRRYVWLKDGDCENGHGRPLLHDVCDRDTLPDHAPVREAKPASAPPAIATPPVPAPAPIPEPVAVVEIALEPEPGPEPVALLEPEPVAFLEPEPVSFTQPDPEPMPEPVAFVELEPEPVAFVELPPEPVAVVELEPEPEPAPAYDDFQHTPDTSLPGYSGPSTPTAIDLPDYSAPAATQPAPAPWAAPAPQAQSAAAPEQDPWAAPAEPTQAAPWAAPAPTDVPAEHPQPEWAAAASMAVQPLPPGAFAPDLAIEPYDDMRIRVAPLSKRVWAYAIDGAVIGVSTFVVTFAMLLAGAALSGGLSATTAATAPLWTIAIEGIVYLAAIAYFPVMEGLRGATIGKQIMGLRVVAEDGSAIGISQGIVRYLGWFLDGLLWGAVGYITANGSPLHQRFGDKWAKTVVVNG